MKIKIACVGRLKEKFYQDAVAEFTKRLSRFAALTVCEVPDERAPETLSEAQKTQVLQKEGERLLCALEPNDYVIALCIDGKKRSSEQLASDLSLLMGSGKSKISFVIGGSLGLWDKVVQRADAKLSFSDMTFSHQLIRVMLLEQVYRAFKIINNEPYHK